MTDIERGFSSRVHDIYFSLTYISSSTDLLVLILLFCYISLIIYFIADSVYFEIVRYNLKICFAFLPARKY
jgi:hypothetical protein